MKAKQLFDKLIENWHIKAICFVIAVFLYVLYQAQSVDTKVFSVPLAVEAKNGFVSIVPHPRTVAVTARGKSDALAQVREADLKAYLDLNYVSKDGEYNFPVLITLSDSASILNPLELKVTPEVVRLRVEEEVTSYVDILPLVNGKPAYGYGVKKITVSPDQIAITGPKTMIENYGSLHTLNVTTSGAKRSFTVKTKVEQKGIFVSHDDIEVSVTVEIEELEGSRQFTKLPVRIVNLSPELEIRAMTTDVTVTLNGSLASLETYKPGESFVTADVSHVNRAGTFYIDLAYSVPKKYTLADGYTKNIPVTFTTRQKPGSEAVAEEENSAAIENTGKSEEKTETQKKR